VYLDNKESFQKRYFSKFISNLFSAVIGIVIISIVTRTLGPSDYGNFNFLTTFFIALIGFFTLSTSMGFFTKLSKRQEEVKLIRFYLGLLGLLPVAVTIFILVVFLLNQEHRFWPNQQTVFILLAALFAFLNIVFQTIRQINDALGYTVNSEKYIILQKIFGIIIIVILFITNKLNLHTFFFYHFVILGFILLLWFLHLNNKGTKPFARKNVLIWSEINKYFREFYLYSHPLFIYSLIALIVNIGGRWLLQTFAGSEQQGFFSLGYSVSALIFLFSGSLTPLFTREFSIAHNNNDFDRMRFLFKKLIPMFYCIVAALGVFVAFNGAQIGILLGGSEFQQAGFVISIMSLYPIHQTYGQLNGSVFYATDQTKLYRNIGIVIKLFGLLLTFYFIGPNSHGGLALGASGIAVSMLIIQFIGVNIQLLYITKFLSISYLKFFLHQCVAIGAFSLLGYLCKWFLGQFIQSNILFLIGNTMIYFLLLCVFVFAFPMIVSMTRTELVNKIKLIIKVNALNKLGLK